ncbi:Transcriptional activator spt7, partial [Dinochytrium kinnereticum]
MYLTPQEGQLFTHVAASPELWDHFMQNPLAVPPPPPDHPHDPLKPSTIVLAAFRIRTMIFEQRIPELFPGKPFSSLVRDCPVNVVTGHSKTNGVTGLEALDASSEELNMFESVLVPIDDMFYPLEHDVETMKEIRKIKSETIKKSPEEREIISHEPAKDKPDMLKPEEASTLNYLFEVIGQSFQPQKATELKLMVSNLRKSRSKWVRSEFIHVAHDYRIGQEQLYDALEKTLNDLKNYTNPMDLGTMTKKLTSLVYMSKEEFAKDAYLIWSNCLIYNTAPESIYRKKAVAMKRRTTELLKKVPDIKIEIKPQEEPEYESEEEPEEVDKNQLFGSRSFPAAVRKDTTHEEIEAAAPFPNLFETKPERADSTISIAGSDGPSKSILGRKRVSPDPHDSMKREEDADMMDVDTGSVGMKQRKLHDDGTFMHVENGTFSDEDGEVVAEVQVVPVVPDEKLEEETELIDVQLGRWKEETLSQRVELCISRDLQQSLPFSERLSLRPSPGDFKAYIEGVDLFNRRNELRRMLINEKSKPTLEELDFLKPAFFPEASHVAATVPLPDSLHVKSQFPDITLPRPSLSEFSLDEASNQSKLGFIIQQNIHSLRRIKQVHSKIISKESDESMFGPFIGKYVKAYEPNQLPELVITGDSAESVLYQVSSKLLAHSGFDAANTSALGILASIGGQYLLNLGRSLRMYLDKYKATVSPERILELSLQSNGVEVIDKLSVYLRYDVERYGLKLLDLRHRLENAYGNLLKATGQEDEDVDLDEAEQQII